MTDEQIDRILDALRSEGFALPYAARARDYLPSGADETQVAEGHEALRAASDRARQANRDALRRAIAEGVDHLLAQHV